MSYIHDDTMVVCFLSSDSHLRAYECDLIDELNHKKLGHGRVLVGEGIDRTLIRPGDLAIDLPGMAEAGDDNTAIVHVIAGQLLAFFRCRREGLKPDSPSEEGVISRVVGRFPLHRRGDRAES
jgi:D-galactosamine 6-phosphate deaminase/isomerase